MEISKHGDGDAQFYSFLVIQDAIDKRKLIYYDLSSKKHTEKIIAEIENKIICCSCYGWFILQDATSNDYCLFYPITSEIIQLPPLPKDPLPKDRQLTGYILSPPSNPNCHVIFSDGITIFSAKPKDSEFTKQHIGDVKLVKGFTLVGEKGYAHLFDVTDHKNRLLEVAFESEGSEIDQFAQLTTLPQFYDNYSFTWFSWYDKYLVELDGELLIVNLLRSNGGEPYNILIWKLNFEKKKWIKIDSIGSWTIFISSPIATACNSPEDSAIQKNAVYFLKQNTKNFRIFNMVDESISEILSFPDVSQTSTFHWMLMDVIRPF